MVQEMGKPLAQAKAEMEGAVAKDDYLDVLVQALEPKEHGTSLVVRQPYGVVAILSPWNFPADEILLLALPALGSGNTVVVKPSEVAPETGQMVVETLASVLPAGVLQVVQGDGVVGERLVQHPSTKLIAMTGSSATGKKIAAQAALGLKRLVLELGGKDPMVVLADADVEAAAADAVAFSLDNTGQVCCSIERIYVAESIYDNFVKAVQRHAATHKVGDGLDEGVTVGPLVSSRQRSHVQVQVDDALAKGARLVYQSELPSDAPAEASFFPVTVLSRVTRDMLIATEETFGPVVCLTPFDGSEETAVSLANDSVYGLAAAVYSQDVTKAQRVASQIQAGQVGINCYAPAHMDVACPWVGHKESGLGYHSGVEGFHNFSIPKSLVFRPS
jgi:acyl-CoA reductase-like NAD-dependent aldehyde dehydrogenase